MPCGAAWVAQWLERRRFQELQGRGSEGTDCFSPSPHELSPELWPEGSESPVRAAELSLGLQSSCSGHRRAEGRPETSTLPNPMCASIDPSPLGASISASVSGATAALPAELREERGEPRVGKCCLWPSPTRQTWPSPLALGEEMD